MENDFKQMMPIIRKATAVAILTVYSLLTSSANVREVILINNGFLVDFPINFIGSDFFVDQGDTVRFLWQSGNHSIQSNSLPSGVIPWRFFIDSINPVEELLITAAGYHYFSINSGNVLGAIICRDTTAPLRYFEFIIEPFSASENFIVATSDPYVLIVVDSLLQLPVNQRFMHIKGLITHGNGGYNHNWSWRFQESRWRMVQASEELCDGWSTFIEDSVNYWVDFLGYFCPWSSKLYQEVFPNPVDISEINSPNTILLYPNPAYKELFIHNLPCAEINKITLTDLNGSRKDLFFSEEANCRIDLSHISPGVYVLQIHTDDTIINELFIIK